MRLACGLLRIKSEKFKEALQLAERLLRKHPTNSKLLVLEGDGLKYSGNLTTVSVSGGCLHEIATISQATGCLRNWWRMIPEIRNRNASG